MNPGGGEPRVRSWIESAMTGEARGPAAAAYRCAARPLAWAYGAGVAARRFAYERGLLRSERVPAPVLSVGNLTAGGVGKTPFVEWLARRLLRAGRRPAIVSRGYRAGDAGENDEFRVLAQNLPDAAHVAAPRRARGARAAIDKYGADCIILDDGFQHLALRRELDIVLVDATRPLGNGALLPCGILREPPRQLRRAGAVVLTRSDLVDAVERDRLAERLADWAPQAAFAYSAHRPEELTPLPGGPAQEPEWLAGKRVFWFCGIGNPPAFVRTLERLGAELVGGEAFPDHYAYRPSDAARLARQARDCRAELMVTTQKDQVKLAAFREPDPPAYALRVALQVVQGEAELWDAVERALAAFERRPR